MKFQSKVLIPHTPTMLTVPATLSTQTVNYLVASGLVGAGVILGRYVIPRCAPSPRRMATRRLSTSSISSSEADSSEDEFTEEDIKQLQAHDDKARGELKMVLVVRTDLKMTKGKIGAQCAHAALACYRQSSELKPKITRSWVRWGQAKVALQVKTETELFELKRQALERGIVACVIRDAGRTQIAAGSATVLGIGPAPKSEIDRVTGHLKLL